MKNNKTYLANFFTEKGVNYQLFEIIDANGLTHLIDTNTVISAIFNSSIEERFIISNTLRKLDFCNQPIIDYLRFLAEALVKKFN